MSATGRPFGGAQNRRWRLRGRFPDGALEGAPYPAPGRHPLWHRGPRPPGGGGGGAAGAYTPAGFGGGYGVNCGPLARLRGGGASLVVTADCGTSSIAEV